MNINLEKLNSREKEIVLSLSILPASFYSVPDLLRLFQVEDNDVAVFFDIIHDLSTKEFLVRNRDHYGLEADTCIKIQDKYKPDAEQCSTIIDYFSSKLEAGKLDYHKEFLSLYKPIASLLKKISGNSFHLAQLSYLLSTSLTNYQKYDEALIYNQRAIEISEKIDKKHPLVALFYRDKAAIYKKLGDSVNAIFYSLKDIEILEKHAGKYDDLLPDSYFALSKTYEGIHNYEKAVEYNLKAIQFEKKRKRRKTLNISGLYHNLAYYYVKQNKLKDASLFINKAVESFIADKQSNNKHYELLLRDQKRFNSLFEFEQFIIKYKYLLLVSAGIFLIILVWALYNLFK